MKLSILLIALRTILVSAQHQETPLLTGPRSDTKATVYIFKTPHAKTLSRITFPVYVDEKLIAKLDGNRYFAILLDPGMHIIRSKNKQAGGVEIELKQGQAYFLRLITSSGSLTVGSPGFTLVPPEEGSYTIKQLKPIKQKDLKDTSAVVMELVMDRKP